MINPMDDLQGKFVIKNEGELIEFDRCGDLPDTFDHLIEFNPTPPEPPHTCLLYTSPSPRDRG